VTSLLALCPPPSLGELRHIHALPGAEPLGEEMGAHLGGYVAAESRGRQLQVYTYFAQHADPAAPLIVWMSGGPGASSLMGLFTELGPFLLNGQSLPKPPRRSDWQVFSNPFGWHTAGSLLAWEQPAGVGFSRCVSGLNCDVWDDISSAEANLAVLVAFFNEHPSELKRDLYIIGESYAGVYVPLLAKQILEYNQRAASAGKEMALRGIGVGNGCVGFGVPGSCGSDSLETLIGYFERGAPGVDADKLAAARGTCGAQLRAGAQSAKELSPACRGALKSVWLELGQYNVYDYASACGPSEQGNWGEGEAFACGSAGALQKYLARAEVQRALGVIPDAPGAQARTWQQWDGMMPGYNISVSNVVSTYKELLEQRLRVFIYNGLRDTCVPTTGAQVWTAQIGGPVAEARRAWAAAGQPVGHVLRYASGLSFATVDGAGHLVPADRPQAALALVQSLVRNEPLPAVPAAPGGACTSVWMGRGYANLCDDEAPLHIVEAPKDWTQVLTL